MLKKNLKTRKNMICCGFKIVVPRPNVNMCMATNVSKTIQSMVVCSHPIISHCMV